MPTLIAIMIILHRKCDRIVRSSRLVIAESHYIMAYFLSSFREKKVKNFCCTNVCKTDKTAKNMLVQLLQIFQYLKTLKHLFVQKLHFIALNDSNLVKRKRPLF